MFFSAVPLSAYPANAAVTNDTGTAPPYGEESVIDAGDGTYLQLDSDYGAWWRFTDSSYLASGKFIYCYTNDAPQNATLKLYAYSEQNGFWMVAQSENTDSCFYLSYYNRPDAVYYLHLEGNGSSRYFMRTTTLDETTLEATKPFGSDTTLYPLANGSTEPVTFTNIDDIKWFQMEIPADTASGSQLKLSLPASAGHPRIDVFTENEQGSLEYLTGSNWLEYPERVYCDVAPGTVVYICLRPWEINTEENMVQAELTAKMTSLHYHRPGSEAFEAAQNIPLSEITASLTANTIQYLNELYLPEDSLLGLRVTHVDDTDYNVLRTLAYKITDGLTTDMEKAVAIATWVSNNITYKSGASAYSIETFYNRIGNCYSYANLMQDLMRLCGIRAVSGVGWRCDPARFTVKSIQDQIGHAWTYAWLDGDWYLFDPLFDSDRNRADYQAHGYNSQKYQAQHYYISYIDGIHMTTDLTPPTILEEGAYYVDGRFAYYKNGIHIAEYHDEFLDDDGEQVSVSDAGYRNSVLWVNDMTFRYTFVVTSGGISEHYVDEPERELPKRGDLITNGCFSLAGYHLAYENGIQACNSIVKWNNVTYYADDTGYLCRIFAEPGEYSLRHGCLTVKSGYSGHLAENTGVINNQNQILEYSSDSMNVAEVDENGIITAKSPGLARITCRVWPRDPETGELDTTRGYIGDFTYFLLVDDSVRVPNYEDTPRDNKNEEWNPGSNDEPGSDSNPGTPGSPSQVKVSNVSTGCKLTWKKVTGAQNYQIYRNGKLTATTASTTWTDTKAKNGKVYTYTIKAKSKANVSNASAKAVIYRLTTVKIKSAKKTSAAKAKVKWSKNAAASGYQIKYISGGKTKTVKVTGAKKLSTTLKKLKKKKTCKIYVRVYKKVKPITYHSAWSKVKKVKL